MCIRITVWADILSVDEAAEQSFECAEEQQRLVRLVSYPCQRRGEESGETYGSTSDDCVGEHDCSQI